jgi:Uncharacterized protein conserved in bacteria
MKEPLTELAEQFRQWYGHRQGHSPVYETIITELIEDEDLLGLVAEAGRRDYVHYLFMGAVHHMLLEGNPHELRRYYATTSPTPGPVDELFPYFRDFCFQHKTALLDAIARHQVQINEVRRCTALLPAFAWACRNATDVPLALIDVGAAAGLNLLLDRFFYDYGPAGTVGDPDSDLMLACEPRGSLLPPLPRQMVRIDWRVGIDRQPVDVADRHAVNWMIALVAPDDRKRLAVLKSALEIAKSVPPKVVPGTGCDMLPGILARVPRDLTVCVFHCFTTHHFTLGEMDRFNDILNEFGAVRDFHVISLEWEGGKPAPPEPVPLRIASFEHGRRSDVTLAHVDWRGGCEWLEWLVHL